MPIGTAGDRVGCAFGVGFGVPLLDGLLEGAGYVEFYGEWGCVRLLAHRYLAYNVGCRLILTQEFGGISTYVLQSIARSLGRPPRVELRRAFSLEDTVEAILQTAAEDNYSPVAVMDPYLYAPTDWRKYSVLSRVVGALRRLARTRPVVVFNRPSKFAASLPEGGQFNRSSVNALYMVSRCRKRVGLHVEVKKHPAQPPRWVCVPYTEIYGYSGVGYDAWARWGGQRLLLEWL
ncbi:MAG: hypothetical protein QW514_05305 [Thermoprotei archaeon]